jgi:hypothetical protein
MKPGALSVTVFSAVLGGAIGSLSGHLFTGQQAVAQPASEAGKVVTAQEFRLVTPDGKMRAKLFLWDGQHPMLAMTDAACKARATFGLSEQEGQPSLVLYDEECRRRAAMDLVPDGLPQVTFRDDTDVPRAQLHLLKDGSPILRLFDPQGKTQWTAAR